MKKNISLAVYFFLSFFILTQIVSAETDTIPGIGIISPTLDETTKSGYYIPKDMEECIDELDNIFPDNIKDTLQMLDFKSCANKYGMIIQWLADNWNMWDTSRVVSYFSQFGFNEPVEIAHGIFRSYWNYLNDNPIRIEMKPKYYALNKNLFLKKADEIVFPEKRPNPKGTIIDSNSTTQFIFMGRKFTLIDSLFDPIINLLNDNGFHPSDSLWYIWWTRIAKFGENVDKLPYFITVEEFEEDYTTKDSYNADFILILEDRNKAKMKRVIRNNKFDDEFKEYLKTKRHMGFYLIRKREVYIFD